MLDRLQTINQTVEFLHLHTKTCNEFIEKCIQSGKDVEDVVETTSELLTGVNSLILNSLISVFEELEDTEEEQQITHTLNVSELDNNFDNDVDDK